MAKKPTVISLFTGAGGLDLGFEAAGFRTAVAVEMDAACCRTIRENRPWRLIEGRIEEVTSETILKKARLRPGEASVLIGGPPCQPFSKSGYWHRGDSRRLEDPRARTLEEYLRVLEDTQPRAFLLENVAGLAYSGKEEGLRFIEEQLEELNLRCGTSYCFNLKILNAAHYGVPQVRERVFLVGSRDGTEFVFPEPRFLDPAGAKQLNTVLESAQETYRTAWDALEPLSREGLSEEERSETAPRGKWARKLLGTIPEGENYLFHTERGDGEPVFGWRRRYWSFLLKLSKNRPSWTITAQPGPAIGPFHWDSRRLTRRELAALQTFPPDYKLTGTLAEAQRQAGNAVPSLLGEVLAREIHYQFLGGPRPGVPRLLPAKARQEPPAESLLPFPFDDDEIQRQLGKDTPHPGNGEGRGAQRRAERRAERRVEERKGMSDL